MAERALRVTVVGAGNAGCAAAADLALAGHEVTLFELERFGDKLDPIREGGAITLVNNRLDGAGRQGDGRIARCTIDPAEAADADVILVATVALARAARKRYWTRIVSAAGRRIAQHICRTGSSINASG